MRNETRVKLFAGSQVGVAALLFSAVPITIHLMVENVNPFIFNAAQWLGLCIAFSLHLTLGVKSAFGKDASVQSVLRGTLPELRGARNAKLIRSLSGITFESKHTHMRRAPLDGDGKRAIARLLRMPMVWMVVAHTNYAFFVWSTAYIDIAVSTTIYELWPLVMVLALARYDDSMVRARERGISNQQRALMVVAFIGLAFVILGQSDASWEAISIFGFEGLFGLVLALMAACLSGLYPVSNMIYADLLFVAYSHQGRSSVRDQDNLCPQQLTIGTNNPLISADRAILWFTSTGLVLSAAFSVMFDVGIGVITANGSAFREYQGIHMTSLAFGCLMGVVVHGVGMLLLRMANLRTSDLGINALFYSTPVLALWWLSWAGISLLRPDLFWIGAGIVLCANGLIQANPDQERDYAKFESKRPWGARLGLTSLVLSIWAIGTTMYLRDDVLPKAWLSWSESEYWELVGLSATIFALIYGFRVSRLTARVTEEDKRMLEFFRDVEMCVHERKMSPSILSAVREIDRGYDTDLRTYYNQVSETLHQGYLIGKLNREQYSSLRKQFDILVHSKQQGKDFAELIAIVLFAALTAALVVTTRPILTLSDPPNWGGFVVELFGTFMVSIVVFLTFNLMDMRRDRHIPLMVPLSGQRFQHGLFFRHKQDLTAARIISTTIVVLMIVLVVLLLRDKWLVL